MMRGLYAAAEKVTDLQEKIARDHGLGEKYGAAKRDYMQFRRGIGSKKAERWLGAGDVFDQALDPKLAKLSNKTTAEGLDTVLKSVGIDTGPFREVMARIGQAEEDAKAAHKYGGEVIKGKATEDLAGIDNVTLNRMKLRMQAKGIANPFALFQILYGLSIMSHSPLYGALHLGYGVGRSAPVEILVRDTAFQDWVLKKAGVIPGSPADATLRQGLVRAGKTMTAASARQVATQPRSILPKMEPEIEAEPQE